MKIKTKLLTTTFLILNSFSVFAEDGEVDTFSGCIGKDVTGREVKVESLSRSLENCPFAKVYLKENEERYKSEIDAKVSDALKTSLDQDLETLMLQGEFFNSLGINLLNYGDNENIKANCKLDKMTDISSCSGKNNKEYERRKNALLEKFGAKDEAEFSQKIKDKFKRMTGRSDGNSCPLISNNEKDLDQFLLYQSSFTKASLLELKSYLKEGDLSEISKKFPMLDLIFKGDDKVAQKFIEEIRGLDESKGENVLVGLIKDKIKNFYGQKENAKSISATMAKTCDDFNKKITKYICSDELDYEAQNATLSRRLFDGFDMSEADLSRNRRVKLQDKEMAFMAFGKKCEIDEREESLVVTQKRLTLDKLIGAEGEYVKGARGEISKSEINDSRKTLKEIAFCQTPDLKSKNLCSSSLPLSAAKLRETYNCPDDKLCDKSIELAANYLEGCEKREARNKLLAQNENTSGNNEAGNGSGTSVERKDPLDLDFFDNLLADAKPEISETPTLKKVSEKAQPKDDGSSKEKGKAATSTDPYAPKGKKPISEDKEISDNGTNKISGAIRNMESSFGSSPLKSAKTPSKAKLGSSSKPSQSLQASSLASASAVVSKDEALMREQLARLEGQYKGMQLANEAKTRTQSQNELDSQIASSQNPGRSKKSKNEKFNDSVYRNGLGDDQSGLDEEIDENLAPRAASTAAGEASSKGQASQNDGSKGTGAKGAGLALNSQAVKNLDDIESNELKPSLILNLDELSAIDESKLNQFWKDKNTKFIIGVKGEKDQSEKMILSLDKDKKPTIDNFQALSAKTRESILKSKLFKEFKIIRQKDLTETIKKAI